MSRFLPRLAACSVLFCANPRRFLAALLHPDSPRGQALRRLLEEAGK